MEVLGRFRWFTAASASLGMRTSKPSFASLFQIKIDRHALPRRTLGRADIARHGGENVLPCPPLLAVRHAIERDCFRQARIGIAAAAPASQARAEVAAPPERGGVAIATLLARLFGAEPCCVFQIRS